MLNVSNALITTFLMTNLSVSCEKLETCVIEGCKFVKKEWVLLRNI